MISKKSQIEMDRIRALNEQVTKNVHAGHKIVKQQWDGNHTIVVCNTCECTIANPVECTPIFQKDTNVGYSREPRYGIFI